MNQFDILKYFNSFPHSDSYSDNICDALIFLINNKSQIVSYNYEEKIEINKYELFENEYGNKYIEIPLYRICDAINNYNTDENTTIELVVNNKRLRLNNLDYIFTVTTLNTQLYIRFTFNKKDFNYYSFNYSYTGYVFDLSIRRALIPQNNIIFYAGHIKYYYVNDNIIGINID